MTNNRKKLAETFLLYVKKNYDANDGAIAWKMRHSVSVGENCVYIAEKLRLPKEKIELAYIAGLLHDTGRFPQLSRYHTYMDSASIPHAPLGADILFKEGLFDTLYPKYKLSYTDRLILEDAIRQHSGIDISRNIQVESISDGDMYWLHKILKDADKIDIFKAYTAFPEIAFDKPIIDPTTQVFTDKCLDDFLNGRAVKHSDMQNGVDELLCCAAFVYKMYYDDSKILAIAKGNVYHLFDICKDMPMVKNDLDKVIKTLEQALKIKEDKK